MLLEIDTIFPKSSEKLHVSHDISKLKYCKAIIKETLRILPATYVIPRCTLEECEIAGYKWPAGTLFQLNRLAANKNPEFWSNPEIFDPERFYDDNKYDKKINDKNLAIFGGSQRICPGRKFGMTELLLLMVLVFKNYNVELVNKNEPLKVRTGISIICKELKVRINPRN
ncbi:30034_t:CDS:1 [Racocetra persica]|uniref:30034_t:CDS:1 n=1 Tax=Racocetra persica TaxID=160502 RepID=A0ACA9S9G8_9GLOM|nr:30034_t:CDS:1 [Racocetra persica]